MGTEQRIAIPVLLTFHIHSQCLFHRCLCKLVTVVGQIPARNKVRIRESANERKRERHRDKGPTVG